MFYIIPLIRYKWSYQISLTANKKSIFSLNITSGYHMATSIISTANF